MVTFEWRGPLDGEETVDLVLSHGGNPVRGWWDRVRRQSLGWVTARSGDGELVGFVNVAWDGGDHAFLLDLHVVFEPELRPFYFDACGFRPTDAGLIDLRVPGLAGAS